MIRIECSAGALASRAPYADAPRLGVLEDEANGSRPRAESCDAQWILPFKLRPIFALPAR